MKITRKILSVCLSFLSVALIAVSGTLAFDYIQQNIEAELAAQQDGIKVDLIQVGDMKNPDFQLLPIREGLSDAQIVQSEQFADHAISVKNEGNVEVYVRILFAVPSSLDTVNDAGKKALHIVESGSNNWSGGLYKENISVNDVLSNVYSYTYKGTLGPNATTQDSAILGFYLDSAVTNNNNGYFLGNTRLDVSEDGTFKIPAAVQAVGTQGFDNGNEAFSGIALPTLPNQEA